MCLSDQAPLAAYFRHFKVGCLCVHPGEIQCESCDKMMTAFVCVQKRNMDTFSGPVFIFSLLSESL